MQGCTRLAGEVNSGDAGPDRASETFGIFHVEELVSTAGDLRVYLARDEHVDRRVLLRVAGEASAGVLLDDARRLAAVSHPGLVAVLGAHRSETGAYAAVQEVDARPLSECGPLSSEHGGRIAIDIAGAIDALARAGLRTPINPATVLVVSTHDGVRGLLDPLRALSLGVSSLAAADPAASTCELADLLEQTVPELDGHLRSAIDGARGGVYRHSRGARWGTRTSVRGGGPAAFTPDAGHWSGRPCARRYSWYSRSQFMSVRAAPRHPLAASGGRWAHRHARAARRERK